MAVKRSPLPMPIRQPLRHPVVRVAARRQRLSDKIRVAFHTACDQGAVEAAEQMLSHLEILLHHPPVLPLGVDRRQPERLTALCERLANLVLWQTDQSHFDHLALNAFCNPS